MQRVNKGNLDREKVRWANNNLRLESGKYVNWARKENGKTWDCVRAKNFPSPSHQSGAHSIILWMEWNTNNKNDNDYSNNKNDDTATKTAIATTELNANAKHVEGKRAKIERTIAKGCNATDGITRVQVQKLHWKFKFVRQKRTIAEIFETWQPYLLQKQRRCKNTWQNAYTHILTFVHPHTVPLSHTHTHSCALSHINTQAYRKTGADRERRECELTNKQKYFAKKTNTKSKANKVYYINKRSSDI